MKFEVARIEVNAPVRATKVKWVPLKREKIKPNFTYHQGHPEGWTDDLGIIADKNQWVEEELSGWHSDIDPQDFFGMQEWCQQNFKHGAWYIGIYYICIRNQKDVAWFMLRWS